MYNLEEMKFFNCKLLLDFIKSKIQVIREDLKYKKLYKFLLKWFIFIKIEFNFKDYY